MPVDAAAGDTWGLWLCGSSMRAAGATARTVGCRSFQIGAFAGQMVLQRYRSVRVGQSGRIACQQAHAVLTCLGMLDGENPDVTSIGVESKEDVFDLELRNASGSLIKSRQHLGIAESAVKNKPPDYVIVREGSGHIPDAALAGRLSAAYVLAEWRFLSGWAHGFLWPVRYTSPPGPPVEGQRFESYKVTMSLDRYLGSVKVGFVAARVAMDRYAALGGIESVPLAQPWDMTYFAD